jgi:dethiobiotin synthetase
LNSPIFITGIGTGVGKTLVSSIIVEALECDYWKPIQAGNESPTDRETVQQNLTNINSVVFPEFLSLKMPASPHYSAAQENISFTVHQVCKQIPKYNCNLIVEGAGGLLVPLNKSEFIIDLIKELNAKVVLVSSGYLGSINHSLLTAEVCSKHQVPVAGWVFNDCLAVYEEQIISWSGYPRIFSLPKTKVVSKAFVKEMAESNRQSIKTRLC